MTAMPRVLCVDDEPLVLEGLERNLSDHFEIVTASSGQAALGLMSAEPPFAAIVSDMRMPQMNGAELLSRARQLAPDTSRLLLTGYAETPAAIAAVNDGHIFRFLCKPCPPDVLHRHLSDAVRQHKLITSERELLANTLNGAIQMMSDLLAVAAPTVFERARQLRARVAHVAAALGCEAAWEYEIAALLASIGCIALPPGIVEKVWAGGRISLDERATYDTHPAIAHRLIAAIPRLERTAEIVRLQRAAKPTGDAVIDQGVALLRAALELDQMLGRHVPLGEALKLLADHHHPRPIVDALGAHARQAKTDVHTVMLADARVGWVLDRDVKNSSGGLLVKSGTVLSPVLLEALQRFATSAELVEPLHVRST
jgi:CheY-like chemotaxis protein